MQSLKYLKSSVSNIVIEFIFINYNLFFVLDKTIKFNELDEEIMSLFTSTAYKVIIKNFKKLNETDLSKLKICYYLLKY